MGLTSQIVYPTQQHQPLFRALGDVKSTFLMSNTRKIINFWYTPKKYKIIADDLQAAIDTIRGASDYNKPFTEDMFCKALQAAGALLHADAEKKLRRRFLFWDITSAENKRYLRTTVTLASKSSAEFYAAMESLNNGHLLLGKVKTLATQLKALPCEKNTQLLVDFLSPLSASNSNSQPSVPLFQEQQVLDKLKKAELENVFLIDENARLKKQVQSLTVENTSLKEKLQSFTSKLSKTSTLSLFDSKQKTQPSVKIVEQQQKPAQQLQPAQSKHPLPKLKRSHSTTKF